MKKIVVFLKNLSLWLAQLHERVKKLEEKAATTQKEPPPPPPPPPPTYP